MLCQQKHQGKQNFRLHSPPEKKLQFLFLALLILSHTQSVLLLQPEHLQNHPSKESTRINRWNRNQICVPIFKTINPREPKRKGRDSNKQGPSSRGDPDEEGDDGDDKDDNDEDNDSRPLSINGHPLSVGNNTQWSPTETPSKKLGAKLPSLHPRQLYWSGE